jgi:AhpD family alkylhydroperoxidase
MAVLSEVFVPKETVSDEFATIAKLYVNSGDQVSSGTLLLDLETSKTIVSIESDTEGYVELFCSEGEDVEIGALLLKISDAKEEKQEEVQSEITIENSADVHPIFSKGALKLLDQNGIAPSKFDNHDFVSSDDVLHITASKPKTSNVPKVVKEEKSIVQGVERVKLPRQKMLEIDYLTAVQSSSLTSTVYVKVSVAGLTEFTTENHTYFKYSVAPTLLQIVSNLLEEYKNFNAYYEDGYVNYYDSVNIGYATDGDYGLKVLTTYNTPSLSITELDESLYQLIMSYRQNSLDIKNITNSTFTVTDLSAEGIYMFSPLINQNQSAILGVSSIDPNTEEMILSFTFDHRITAGKEASSFLKKVKMNIEELGVKKTKTTQTPKGESQNTNQKGVSMSEELQMMFQKMQKSLPGLTKNFTALSQDNLVDNAITKVEKKLILISLAVSSQCSWCIDLHVSQAFEIGIEESKIIEAAAQAVIMGGGPKMMYMVEVFEAIEKYKK